jgi:hypothetical protein
MKAKPTIAAFLSCVRADDEYENGRISRLRERLEKAIRFHSDLREFQIFQDWKDTVLENGGKRSSRNPLNIL